MIARARPLAFRGARPLSVGQEYMKYISAFCDDAFLTDITVFSAFTAARHGISYGIDRYSHIAEETALNRQILNAPSARINATLSSARIAFKLYYRPRRFNGIMSILYSRENYRTAIYSPLIAIITDFFIRSARRSTVRDEIRESPLARQQPSHFR